LRKNLIKNNFEISLWVNAAELSCTVYRNEDIIRTLDHTSIMKDRFYYYSLSGKCVVVYT
jgi:hypothetical protein